MMKQLSQFHSSAPPSKDLSAAHIFKVASLFRQSAGQTLILSVLFPAVSSKSFFQGWQKEEEEKKVI